MHAVSTDTSMSTPMPATFRCEKRSLTLTRAGCARLFLSAETNRPQPWEGRAACLNCTLGAAHAGRAVVPAAVVLAELRLTCAACRRPAERLIRGEHCPSCYNRRREVAKGRNRKGTRPRLRLFGVALAVSNANGSPRLAHVPGVATVAEAALIVVKRASANVMIGWAGGHAA